MKSVRIVNLIFIFSALLAVACNNGRNSGNQDNDSATLGDRIDNMADTVQNKIAEYREDEFVTDVIKENKKEIAWLNAGIKNGQAARLKTDARSMLKDHENMGKEMSDYAGRKNYTVADVDTMNVVDINDRSGKEWDKAWADKMVNAHEKLIDKFERNQDKVQDAELKTMITNTLPTLRSHLDMARQLRDMLK